MKASVLFGAGWEGDSLEVLWRDAGRVFCKLWRDDAEGQTHAFVSINSDAAVRAGFQIAARIADADRSMTGRRGRVVPFHTKADTIAS
jgi:hypothetical protein